MGRPFVAVNCSQFWGHYGNGQGHQRQMSHGRRGFHALLKGLKLYLPNHLGYSYQSPCIKKLIKLFEKLYGLFPRPKDRFEKDRTRDVVYKLNVTTALGSTTVKPI